MPAAPPLARAPTHRPIEVHTYSAQDFSFFDDLHLGFLNLIGRSVVYHPAAERQKGVSSDAHDATWVKKFARSARAP